MGDESRNNHVFWQKKRLGPKKNGYNYFYLKGRGVAEINCSFQQGIVVLRSSLWLWKDGGCGWGQDEGGRLDIAESTCRLANIN